MSATVSADARSRRVPIAACFGATGFAISAVGVLARHIPISSHAALILAAASPYLMLAAPLSLSVLLVVVTKRRLAAGVIACLVPAAVFLPGLAPAVTQDHPEGLRIMTANLRIGSASAPDLVEVARHRADVVALQELTGDALRRLSDAGLDTVFPFRAAYPLDDAAGAGLWSRAPITGVKLVGKFRMVFIEAKIRLGRVEPSIMVAHLPGPWPQPIDDWQHDIALLGAVMDRAARDFPTDPVIVAGDLNSTEDMMPFRRLLRGGYTDAADHGVVGGLRTFPSGSWLPPLIGIDHVLARNCRVTSVETLTLPESDHRALLTGLVLAEQ